MQKPFLYFFLILTLASCRSTRQIGTAISTPRDTVVNTGHEDTLNVIRNSLAGLRSNYLEFRTFSAKINVDYQGAEGKKYNFNAKVNMQRDSALWISANAILGIEAMRLLVTRDSIKWLDKINNTYTARSVDYLQEITQLPLDLHTLQDLIVGNPVFLDSNVQSYFRSNAIISLLSTGPYFKNLITINESDKTLAHSKLDDVNPARSRTADLSYTDIENKKGFSFSTKRRIVITEKNRLDIKMEFKNYELNGEVSFPFSIPKNYSRS